MFLSKLNCKFQGTMPPHLESNLNDSSRYPGDLKIIEAQIEDKALTNLELTENVDGKESARIEERIIVKKSTNWLISEFFQDPDIPWIVFLICSFVCVIIMALNWFIIDDKMDKSNLEFLDPCNFSGILPVKSFIDLKVSINQKHDVRVFPYIH